MSDSSRPASVTESSAPSQADRPLLEVRDLKVHFSKRRGLLGHVESVTRAVDGVSFQVEAGKTFGLVGESGCGKSTTARAILRLVPITDGQVWLEGERIDQLSEQAMRPHRRSAQMIFQDPYASLNPRMTLGRIITEPMKVFDLHATADRPLHALRLMETVGLDPRLINRYPHELSGGQRQRVGIARALAAEPRLILCDEPVSALDVSVQAGVINELRKIQRQLGVAFLFIAHDLAVVRHISHRIGVMYLGRLVETAPAEELYRDPRHPYTQALLSAVPIPDPRAQRERQLLEVKGEIPSPDRAYAGCPFADRCPIVEERCRREPPPLEGTLHQVACFKAEGD